jgi:LysR family transcriptional regulator, hca operon transcriptional activator
MGILRDELPNIEVVIQSVLAGSRSSSPSREGRLGFLRPEKKAPALIFKLLRKEPLIVVMPSDHPLASQVSIRPQEIAGEMLIGVPTTLALKEVTDRYAAQLGIDFTPHHEAANLSMAISLVASTHGVSLLPLYAVAWSVARFGALLP